MNRPAKPKSIWATTVDNPFDPFTEYERWLNFDEQNGYNTSGRIMSYASTSENLSEKENDDLINYAVNQLLDFSDTYMGSFYRLAIQGEESAWHLPNES